DLEDFGRSQGHLAGEGGQVRRGEAAVCVLDEVEMLDQEIGTTGRVAEQLTHLGQGAGIHLAALGGRAQGHSAEVPAASLAWRHARKVGNVRCMRKSDDAPGGGPAAVARMLQRKRAFRRNYGS